MKFLQVCGPSHRDDGAPFYIKKALNELSECSCERVPVTLDAKEWPEHEFVLYADWGQDNFPHLPHPAFPPKTFCWQSDTHWNSAAYEYRKGQSKHAAVAFICQLNGAQQMSKDGLQNIAWLPHAADHRIYSPPALGELEGVPPDPKAMEPLVHEASAQYDLCWVGHYGTMERVDFLDKVFKAFSDRKGRFHYDHGVFFREAAKRYWRARIVLNKSIYEDLNMRTFEVLATRSFLLTDRQHGMEELGLKDGEHCAIYGSAEEAIDKAKYYLDRPKLRRDIARAGWEWVLKEHTYTHRAQTFLSAARNLS